MTDFKIFHNEKFGDLRAVKIDGVLWFVGKDVCDLIHKSASPFIKKNINPEDWKITKETFNCKNPIKRTCVNIFGLSVLLSLCDFPDREEFKKWILDEVIESPEPKFGATSQTSDGQLQVFHNAEFGQIRTLIEGNKILFCGYDVASALGYAKPRNAIYLHCKCALNRGALTKMGDREMLFIPEPDLYRLIFSSKMPSAERFTDWVVEKVLPTIRKTGQYKVEDVKPEKYLEAARILAEAKETNKKQVLDLIDCAIPGLKEKIEQQEKDEKIKHKEYLEKIEKEREAFRNPPFNSKKLYNLVRQLGWNSVKLANKVHCDSSYVALAWMQGQLKPNELFKQRIIKAFDVEGDYFDD